MNMVYESDRSSVTKTVGGSIDGCVLAHFFVLALDDVSIFSFIE